MNHMLQSGKLKEELECRGWREGGCLEDTQNISKGRGKEFIHISKAQKQKSRVKRMSDKCQLCLMKDLLLSC